MPLNTKSQAGLASAHMFQFDNLITTPIPGIGTWVQVVNFTAGELDNVTFASSKLTIDFDGKFLIMWKGTLQDGNNINFEGSIDLNGTPMDQFKDITQSVNITQFHHMSGNGILTLVEGDVISMITRNLTNVATPTYVDAQVSITKII